MGQDYTVCTTLLFQTLKHEFRKLLMSNGYEDTCEDADNMITGCWEELRKKHSQYCSDYNNSAVDISRENFCVHIFTTKSRGGSREKVIRGSNTMGRVKVKEVACLKLDRGIGKMR